MIRKFIYFIFKANNINLKAKEKINNNIINNSIIKLKFVKVNCADRLFFIKNLFKV